MNISAKLQAFLEWFLLWRQKHLTNKSFILILSVLVGVCGGLAAVILKTAVYYIQLLVTEGVPREYVGYLFVLFPLVGILLTVCYKIYLLKGQLGHGIPNILYNISQKSSIVEKDKTYSHMVSSSLTVGFGGSVGLEAPIVTTGSAIGSNLGRLFQLDYRKRTLLIGCGAAAAIGGIFNAPIAGVIFTMEVLLLQLAIPAYIPLLIAAVTATIVSKYLMGGEILFSFALQDPFVFRDIPYYILLGIFTGLVSVYFARMAYRTENRMMKIQHPFKRAAIGGLLLGFMILLFPQLYGEGFDTIKNLLKGDAMRILADSVFLSSLSDNTWLLLVVVAAIICIKVFATAITIGAGGNGGIFAPSLFMGALSGFLLSYSLNKLDFIKGGLSEENFVLVGMAGMLSGLLHAPLTAIFLIAEVTNGYMLILPLMIVSAIAYATNSYFEPDSVYTRQLARKQLLPFQDKDKSLLTHLQINDLVEKDLKIVHTTDTLGEIVNAVSQSKRNIFPVLDEKGVLHGIILLDNIREIMFKPDMYDQVYASELMTGLATFVKPEDSMQDVMRKFDESDNWNLPVIDEAGKYIGLLSKSKIFSHYREALIRQAKDDKQIIE